MFSYKLFRNSSDVLLAICDDELLGKTFASGDIEIIVSEFYKDRKCGSVEALKLAEDATVINAVGENIIKLLIEKKIIEKSSVMKIGKTLHAQVVSVGE